MINDKRCVGRNLLQTRRDAKIKALELISSMDYEKLLFNEINYGDGLDGVESDRDITWLAEELDKEIFRIGERLHKLKANAPNK